MKQLTVTVLSLFVLCGCVAKFNDESVKYSSIINKEYTTLKDLDVYGYTLKVEKNKKLDGYTIHQPPGVSGPEIVSRTLLPIGTKFRIYRIESCSNCVPFTSYTRYLIKLVNQGDFAAVPMHFGEDIINEKYVVWQ